jgi:hypothetical protein
MKLETKEDKKRFKQTFLMGFIVGLLFVGLGFGAFFLFGKKEASPVKCKDVIYSSNKVQLNDQNQKFQIGEKVYNIKYVIEGEDRGILYVNDSKVDETGGSGENLVTSFADSYLFIEWPGAQGGFLVYGYFDENGNYYDLSNVEPYIYNVTYENGALYCYVENNAAEVEYFETKKVELTLDGTKITVKDIKNK